MASSCVAFERFEMWKNSHTVLRLTVYDKGAIDHFTGSISHVDFDAEQVSFLNSARPIVPALDLSGATFAVEPRRVVASHPDVGKVIFEEIPKV